MRLGKIKLKAQLSLSGFVSPVYIIHKLLIVVELGPILRSCSALIEKSS